MAQGCEEGGEETGGGQGRQGGQEDESAVKHIFTRLSILLMRGNAAILANIIFDHFVFFICTEYRTSMCVTHLLLSVKEEKNWRLTAQSVSC